jgi:hypothetical protein
LTSKLDVISRREVLVEIVHAVSDGHVADGTPAEVAGVGQTLEERMLAGVM